MKGADVLRMIRDFNGPVLVTLALKDDTFRVPCDKQALLDTFGTLRDGQAEAWPVYDGRTGEPAVLVVDRMI